MSLYSYHTYVLTFLHLKAYIHHSAVCFPQLTKEWIHFIEFGRIASILFYIVSDGRLKCI